MKISASDGFRRRFFLNFDEPIFYRVYFILSKEKCTFVQNIYFSC